MLVMHASAYGCSLIGSCINGLGLLRNYNLRLGCVLNALDEQIDLCVKV